MQHLYIRAINFLSNEITIADLQDFGLIAYKASRGNSLILFLSQRLDLLFWFYVYLLGFSLLSNFTHHLALYQVSIRTLERIATPLPSFMASLPTDCGLLHLAVKTCGQFISDWISAMPGTLKKSPWIKDFFDFWYYSNSSMEILKYSKSTRFWPLFTGTNA